MIIDDPNDMDDIERKIKFDEIAREFGRSIAAFECAPYISEFELMEREGLHCPTPEEAEKLDADSLSALLWTVIEFHAKRNTYLSPTDHLSDRELYRHLYEIADDEPGRDWAAVLEPHELTQVGSWHQHFDLISLDTDEDVQRYAKYFLPDDDKKERELYATMFGKRIELPPYEGAPFDRDRFLPRPLEEKLDDAGLEPTPDQVFDRGEVDPRYDFSDPLGDDVTGDDVDKLKPRRDRFMDDDIPF